MISDRFNEAARVDEQKEVGKLRHDVHRQNLLREIRQHTEIYLGGKEKKERDFQNDFQQRYNDRFTKLLKEQGYRNDFMPPGTRRNLEAEAKRDVENAHQGDLNKWKTGHEKEVRDRIDKSVRVDRLEQRAEQYNADRDSWVSQRTNVVERLSHTESAVEKQRCEGMLQGLDDSWSRTVERHFDTERDRGIGPEFGRAAHDIGRSQ